METVSASSETPDLLELARRLPYDILVLIRKELFHPSHIGGRPFDVDQYDLLGVASGTYHHQDINFYFKENELNRYLDDLLLFRTPPGAPPRAFDCLGWLSPGFKLGCTIRIQTIDALYQFEEMLSQQTDVGSYVGSLLVNAGQDWAEGSKSSRLDMKRTIKSIVEKLPAHKNLVLRHECVNAFLAVEQLSLLSNLELLSLASSQNPTPSLANIPRSITNLGLDGIYLPPAHELEIAFPRLQLLTILPSNSRRTLGMLLFAASTHLRTLHITSFDHQDVRALLESAGPRLSEVHISVGELTEYKVPSWFFDNLAGIKLLGVLGYCNIDILASIPNTVRVFKWMATGNDNLRDAIPIFESLAQASTLPNLESIPSIRLMTSVFYDDPLELADIEHRTAIRHAAQIALTHLRDARKLSEAVPVGFESLYTSLWSPAIAFAA